MARRKRRRDELAELGRKVLGSPRIRHFRSLGLTVILLPLDVVEYRGAGRMMFGTFFGYGPDEIVALRARRLDLDGDGERTWWVYAVRFEEGRTPTLAE